MNLTKSMKVENSMNLQTNNHEAEFSYTPLIVFYKLKYFVGRVAFRVLWEVGIKKSIWSK